LWLPVADVIEHNRDLVADTGEPHQILSQSLLESACERPRNIWHYMSQDDMPTLAVELMMSIARNHAFVQGNKRTGFVSGLDFLRLNGYTIASDYDRIFGWAIEGALIGPIPIGEFIEMVAQIIEPIQSS
jgi:death-on-curing protein